MDISKPIHSESRTIWYVVDAMGDVAATLEIGQLWESESGATYRLLGVNVKNHGIVGGGDHYVLVERCDNHYADRSVWHVASLVNGFSRLLLAA